MFTNTNEYGGSCNVDIIERELENIDLIADNQEIVKTIVIKSTISPNNTKWNKKYEIKHSI